MITNRQEAARLADKAHRQNILKGLEHRLKVARDKGDENLIRHLEAEIKHFA
ncbi:MAG: hypothetical protein KME64_45005 [Scytonematopsis contorta HA4267-MV1]|jgi:hypothetical protein|nr:hypothetical protein [Scytonematopsis contorta HA4267-MV1]